MCTLQSENTVRSEYTDRLYYCDLPGIQIGTYNVQFKYKKKAVHVLNTPKRSTHLKYTLKSSEYI